LRGHSPERLAGPALIEQNAPYGRDDDALRRQAQPAGQGALPGAAAADPQPAPRDVLRVRDDNERARELAREIADRLKRRGSLPEVIGDLPLGSHPKRRRRRLSSARIERGQDPQIAPEERDEILTRDIDSGLLLGRCSISMSLSRQGRGADRVSRRGSGRCSSRRQVAIPESCVFSFPNLSELEILKRLNFNRWRYSRPHDPWDRPEKEQGSRRHSGGSLVYRHLANGNVEIEVPTWLVLDALSGRSNVIDTFELTNDDPVRRILTSGWEITSARVVQGDIRQEGPPRIVLELRPDFRIFDRDP